MNLRNNTFSITITTKPIEIFFKNIVKILNISIYYNDIFKKFVLTCSSAPGCSCFEELVSNM